MTNSLERYPNLLRLEDLHDKLLGILQQFVKKTRFA